MKKFLVLTALMVPLSVFAEGMPAAVPINQSIFQPETTRPLYNIERNTYTNNAIQKMSAPAEDAATERIQPSEPQNKKGLRGLFEGFTVEW